MKIKINKETRRDGWYKAKVLLCNKKTCKIVGKIAPIRYNRDIDSPIHGYGYYVVIGGVVFSNIETPTQWNEIIPDLTITIDNLLNKIKLHTF
jgi:hypothetical protein